MSKRALLVAIILAVLSLSTCTWVAFNNQSDFTKIQFYSASLHKEMKVDVYLPPNYSPKQKYPVLYLLHGFDSDQNSWMTSLLYWNSIHIDKDATRLIEERKIHPILIVSPEIDNGYGIDTSEATYSVDGYSRGQYSKFITQDLVHYIDAHYSVVNSSDGRYIGGFSMGGFAALHAAFTNQNLYSKVGVISAALWDQGLPSSLSWIYPTREDQESRDPITLAKLTPLKMPVYMVEGKSDPFYSANLTLTNVLQAQGANVTLHMYPGEHDYGFWRSHANELLLFFAG